MANIVPQLVPSLANGVSQQSPAMRLRDQVEAAYNVRSTVITGAGPRTGTKHRAVFDLAGGTGEGYDKALPFTFDRGPDGCFGALIVDGDIRVFNLDTASECVVAFPSGKTWLSGVNPEKEIRTVAAGDVVFITNRTKAVAMTGDVTAGAVNEAFVYCRSSNYEDVTTITLDDGAGTVLTWKMKAPGTAGGNGPLSSSNVATAIRTILTTNSAPSAAAIDSSSGSWTVVSAPGVTATSGGYTVVQRGALLRITRTSDAKSFTVKCYDQDNAKKIYQIQRTIAKFTDLPSVFWPNSIIKVSANSETNSLEYWVIYKEVDADGQPVTGYWKECPAPGTAYKLDPETMPWLLRATGSNTFSFGPATWDDRTIGSADTIPPPSFVGQPIQDLFFIGGRLGAVFFDGAATSRSSDQPFNFWRETSTQLLDTDPIDIITGDAESVSFHSVSLVGNEPVMFSGNRQGVLTVPQGETLSPRVADLKLVSSYQSPSACPPLAFETGAYYVTPGSNYVGVSMFELMDTDPRKGSSKAVSEHVPAYIKAPIHQIVGCASENMVLAVGGELRREVFVYEFLDTDDKGRVQSSWTTWTFAADDRICGMYVQEKKVHFLIRRGTALCLETMDISSDKLVGPRADLIIMDRKVDQTEVVITFDELDFGCYITLPYDIPEGDNSFFLVDTATNSAGGLEPVGVTLLRRVDHHSVKIMRDVRGNSFLIGRAPRVYLEPSEQVARNQNGDPIFADASVVAVGPILGQSSGLLMRTGLKSRRNYAKLLAVGDGLRREPVDHTDMFTPTHYTPGKGEFLYILRSEAEEKIPKRFFKAAGNVNDVLIAFENNGPLSFKVAGIMYRLNVKSGYSGQ
ncbi:tail tubular protein B [Rhizobium phage RHph_I20]|uniref:Tail tubular protein B n=1 Tax=Rhizobium phage RHph_I20 TaxID=2509730 RepID=A0A7S5UZK8_9CAUD|nr:tail tubular protein B [Rhizobium phage RHph_I20]